MIDAKERGPTVGDLDDADTSVDRRRRGATAVAALLVALMAGVALAYFLTSQSFGQRVVAEPLGLQADGLENLFGSDPRVQPWRMSSSEEGRVEVISGEFTIHNDNEMPVSYALGATFLDEVRMQRSDGQESEGEQLSRRQFDELEIRQCAPASDQDGSLLGHLGGGSDGDCSDWFRLSEIESEEQARDLGTLEPDEARDYRFDLRLRDTNELQDDDRRTFYEFELYASTE